MNTSFQQTLESEIIDDNVHLTLVELCKVCKSSEDVIRSWVVEGVLMPSGQDQQGWHFNGIAVQRARLAQSLAQELEINESGIALALDLLDRIHQLEAQLARISHY